MIKKLELIKMVDHFRATNDIKGALALQATLVKGHNYVSSDTNVLSLLKMNYYGFKAELIFERMLQNSNISYIVEDKYHDYVIQYGDPFVQMKDSCDYIINNKRYDIKYKEHSFFIVNADDFEKWLINYVTTYKKDEVERKKLDYFVFFDSDKNVITFDCHKNKIVDIRQHNIII